MSPDQNPSRPYAGVQHVVHGYEQCAAVLRDDATYSSRSIREEVAGVMGRHSLAGLDGREHRRLRGCIAPAFRASAMTWLENEFILPVIDEHLDRLASATDADLVRSFTLRFPARVIAAILGLPKRDHAHLHRLSLGVVSLAQHPSAAMRAAGPLREYLAQTIAHRRVDGSSTGLIGDLLGSQPNNQGLSDSETVSLVLLLLVAGIQTVSSGTASLLSGLLTNRDQLEAVRDDPSRTPSAIEEALRHQPPLVATSRVAVEQAELGDASIAPGTRLIVDFAAANRDQERWRRSNSFDISRETKPNLAFGLGPHICLGMHLARAEMRTAVTRLLERFPTLALTPEANERESATATRPPLALPVRLT
jgi:cytochrome P450